MGFGWRPLQNRAGQEQRFAPNYRGGRGIGVPTDSGLKTDTQQRREACARLRSCLFCLLSDLSQLNEK